VTAAFERGALDALEQARRHGASVAILKEGSPSCGTSFVYDGTFTSTPVSGDGMTAALLREHGIRVFSEHELDAAAAYVVSLERSDGDTPP
jgi:uncharacterized protein YbbK (DUF523 family)